MSNESWVGRKVRCVDASNMETYLIKGHIYRVDADDEHSLRLMPWRTQNRWFGRERFVLADEPAMPVLKPQSAPRRVTCAECRHYNELAATYGECRRYPPSVVMTDVHRCDYFYAQVRSTDWCGEAREIER